MTDVDKITAFKTDVYKKARSALLLCLDNKVLREVNKEDSAPGVWLKLETLYMTKSLANKLGSPEERLSKRNKKKSTGFIKKNARQGSGMHYEGYDNGDLLMAVSEERFLEWIKDSGGSFHMTPMRDFLFDFKEFNGGTVLLGDNKACAIMGTDKHYGYTVKFAEWKSKGRYRVCFQYGSLGFSTRVESLVGADTSYRYVDDVFEGGIGFIILDTRREWRFGMLSSGRGVGLWERGGGGRGVGGGVMRGVGGVVGEDLGGGHGGCVLKIHARGDRIKSN
ncbi:hypothetical protein Tco_0668567 [Tanacetum coccineum]